MAASSSSAPALAPAPAPDPHWTILGRVALLQRTIGELVCVAVAKPPCASTLTVRTSALLELTDDGDDYSDKDRYVAAVAADADADSASLLLHVSRCPLIGVDLDLNRPGTLLVATGFVPADASEHVYTTTDVVRLPDRTSPDSKPVTSSCIRSLGLISFPGSGGADYMVADLRLADGAKDLFSLLSFRSGTDAWVERQLSCPSMCGLSVLWSSDDVIAHDQKLWWMNFELGLLGCDVFSKEPGLEHVILPQTLTEGLLNTQSGGGILRTSQGKLRYVEIARPLTDPPQNTVITIWTLLDHFPWWEKRCSTNLGSIWSSRCYKDSKLPEEAPVIAFVHPQDPDAVFFLLQKFIFSVNVPQNRIVNLIEDPSVVGVLSGNTVLQPICWRYILSWELPPCLHKEHLSMPFDDFMALLESPTADHHFEQAGGVAPAQPDPGMFLIELPTNFQFDQALDVSSQYPYETALDLLDQVRKQDNIKWVSREAAYAFLLNAQLFPCKKISDEEGRYDGRIAVISHQQLCQLEVDYSGYTTTCRPLKERVLKWRPTRNKNQQHQVKFPPATETTSGDVLKVIEGLTAATKEVAANQKALTESIRANHEAAAASNIALAESFKEFSASHKAMMECINRSHGN